MSVPSHILYSKARAGMLAAVVQESLIQLVNIYSSSAIVLFCYALRATLKSNTK